MALLHNRLALGLLVFAALLGLWGTISLLRSRRISPGYRSSFLALIALTAVQGLLGATTFLGGNRPHQILHIVYGLFAIVFLPGAYVYSARRRPDQEATILAVACWVVAIAFGRGITTGH